MQKLKSHKYEGKNSEELLNKALNELNASTDEVYTSIKEEAKTGLFKSKKYELTVVLKDDVVEYIIQSKLGTRVNVILDANDYKEKQEKNIERLAVKLAKDVVKTNIEVKMDRMNSYERRLVHNRLSNFKGVTTESTGEEPNRCVVIKPVEK